LNLSLGIVEGRNIWKNDFTKSLETINRVVKEIGTERVMIAPSCSLLHVPCDLELETNEKNFPKEIKNWMAFAKQKTEEVALLANLASENPSAEMLHKLKENKEAILDKKASPLIHKQHTKYRLKSLDEKQTQRKSNFKIRKQKQQAALHLPLFATTTIGSFPQTKEIRNQRAKWKKGELSNEEYDKFIKDEIAASIKWQEGLGLDVLVHGEFERNDMVEYFGEQLEGFAFTKNGWVQSYGSRCVKPPVIFGDVERKKPMTVYYTKFAQSLTGKPVKGMLTGPVTILQWSFVRNDQPRSETCMQIAFAIRDEVSDLEKANIKVIQIDEPAFREGLPLRKENWRAYLDWAVKAFRIASTNVDDETQIHTHMCYSEFNDIIEDIAAMDADVITIETSRSQMELLDVFAAFKYPNDIGPGVYDIHSPRVPSKEEMIALIEKAIKVIPAKQIWINPDCGLKTRNWPETKAALKAMIDAAKELRLSVNKEILA
jgi:5-methyltetrahydropteroyltriglutamate--homocysteine methyltransferase